MDRYSQHNYIDNSNRGVVATDNVSGYSIVNIEDVLFKSSTLFGVLEDLRWFNRPGFDDLVNSYR